MKGDAAGQGVVPLRTILRNILNLIDSFEARYKEGLDSYDQEFQELKQFSENLKSDPNYVCKEGEKTVNRKKNRYKDILPFDYTRVILGDYGDIPGNDYINANFIKGASGSSAYIACQGPLPHTVNDFWRMVVECEVQVIVMACNEQESGKHKCENYWVEEEGVEREFGHVTVWLKKSRQVCPDFLVRTMKIRYPNSKGEPEERSVCQFHYSAWPDHGVPLKVRPLLEMVRLIRDCQTSETLPVLVHCSAGCGRTGTICAIDYVWGLLRLGKLTPDFSLFNLVREMRRQRIAMVQTKDQYILVHRAVRELFEEQLKIIDSHPYANVDINGLPLEPRGGSSKEEPLYETVQFSPTKLDDEETSSRKPPKSLPPPIPNSNSVEPSSFVATSKYEKEAENHQRQLEQEKLLRVNGSTSISDGDGTSSSAACTPSPLSDSKCEVVRSESKETLEQVKGGAQGERVSPKRGSFSNKQGSSSSKSTLFRNPSIVKLKAFFEKSKDDKEKKAVPTLSRAKSDVSSSSRFYTNFTSSFTSRGNRNSPSRSKNFFSSGSKPTSPKEDVQDKEKPKSQPKSHLKQSLAVKRSKSLKIVRPADDVDHGNLVPSSSISPDVPDSSKLIRSSISSSASQSSSSSQTHLESNAIKVSVKQMEIPKLQKPVSKSVKPVSLKATTQDPKRRPGDDLHMQRVVEQDFRQGFPSKKPELPSKPNLTERQVAAGDSLYGTTRIKISFSDDMKSLEKANDSKINGKIKKYGTVNPKTLSSVAGGTMLTRSQSHVWQPSKVQVPVRIFSDENLSQVGSEANNDKPSSDESTYANKSVDEPDGVKLIRKQSLPITKLFSSKIKPISVNSIGSPDVTNRDQPRSLTLTSHSSFLEARRKVPKTNPYANYNPNGDDKSQSLSLLSMNKEKGGSPLTQYHFGENVSALKNMSAHGNIGNSSESSSNPGTPRTSLPGTPTQSIDALYSPLSLNVPGNYLTNRGQSKSILKGSLSSTPSESEERLDSYRNHQSSVQSPVPTNITGPQKISSVRIAVGVRERRNSFRQAVWKEDQAPTATSIPVENEKSENIYITTTTSVPYFVKSTSMPVHQPCPPVNNSNTSTTPVFSRPHRDYEPIWPDPVSSSNPFRIGSSTSSSTMVKPDYHYVPGNKPPQHVLSSNSSQNSFSGEARSIPGKVQQNKESQVKDRMAEIKVLLEELKAPGKCEDVKQRKGSSDMGSSQIPLRKSNDKLSQSFTGDKVGMPGTSTNLKHHRSLRAPSRPQYQPGLSCFTFRKPSSFESITDQLYAEDLRMSATRGNHEGSSPSQDSSQNKSDASYFNESFQHTERNPKPTATHAVNDYVSLRTCRSASVTRATKTADNSLDAITDSPINIQHSTSKSDMMPIPPPRSKRSGHLRKDQSDYVNITPSAFHPSNNVWMGKEANGNTSIIDNHCYNGIRTGVNSEPHSKIERAGEYQQNGHGLSRISNTGPAPLSNDSTTPTSPKAIIRALGLFQAKAANVRSRFANWTENKDRPGSKRNYGPIPTKRNEHHNERGDISEGPSSRVTPSSMGPSTSKHQYL